MSLEMEGVRFGYPDHDELFHGLSMSVGTGEIVGIKGRSGCGKSTLLKILAGFLTPSQGLISWEGMSRPAPGTVAMIFQDATGSLNPRWPIARSVGEGLFRLSARQRRERVRAALSAVGMADVDPELLPGQLSGGQCQRIAIARVHANPPELLLADEPTSALDASVGAGIMRLLRDLADLPTGIVLVSHDPAVLSVLADRVLALDQGRLLPLSPGQPYGGNQ